MASEEAQENQEIETAVLKRSCAGYIGNLARGYNDVERLMLSRENLEEVLNRQEQLKRVFELYESKFDSYVEILRGREAVRAQAEFDSHQKNHLEFNQRVDEWVRDAESGDTVNPDVADDRRSIAESRASRQSSQSTSSSYKLREAKAKQKLAELKREQLSKKQELEREQLRLKERLDSLEAAQAVEAAETEVRAWQDEIDEAEISETSPSVKAKHVHVNHDNVKPQAVAVQNTENEKCQSAEQKAGVNLAKLCQTMVLAMSIPKPEISTFSGDPVDYWSFINNFEASIACKCVDDRSKLVYLIQYCKGRARESIENCVLLEPESGYIRAREILADQFGQPHHVTHAMMNQVLSRPAIRSNDGQALWHLARSMQKCQITLEQMGYKSDLNCTDSLLKIQLLLPVHLQARWAKQAQGLIQMNVEPNFSHITEFVVQAAKVACNMYGQNVAKSSRIDKPSPCKPKTNKQFPNRSERVTTLTTQGDPANKSETTPQRSFIRCPCCSKPHRLEDCADFAKGSFRFRLRLVRRKRLCDNCLKPSHMADVCRSPPQCKQQGCGRKHHPLLHRTPVDDNKEKDSETQAANSQPPSTSTGAGAGTTSGGSANPTSKGECNSTVASKKVCLRIVPVRVKGRNVEVKTWALLDDGSDVSLCDRRLVDQLGLEGIQKEFYLTTVNEENRQKLGREVDMTVQSLDGSESVHLPRVWTVDRLPVSSCNIPVKEDVQEWPHLRGLEFPQIPAQEVMLLIGSDVPEVFWQLEERRGNRKEPYAVRSLLGWTLIGPTAAGGGNARFIVNHASGRDDLLHRQVQRFWELDFGVPVSETDVAESLEDKRARRIMEESVIVRDGHYEIGLPWRAGEPHLPNNRPLAEARLRHLKRRLERDSSLHEKYRATMDDYLAKGYAEEVKELPEKATRDEKPAREGALWYLPHHPVVHPLKQEKVRIVFDCAARFNGTSLNEQLLQGPTLTNNLVGVLTRFREEPYAIVGDIESMFHQVRVPEKDCDSLRFLWWRDGDYSKEPAEYRMVVHLFGATSSPSCAAFALRRTALESEGFDETAVQSVLDNFYVDDCLVSVRSRDQAIVLAKQLCDLLATRGFRLRKWVSNDREILSAIPCSERAASVKDLALDELPVEHTLGVQWHVESDKFGFKVIVKDKPSTRRGILSVASSLYDPLGFLSPFILLAKVLLQDICRRGIGWDNKVPVEVEQRWREWLSDLPGLQNLKIDRCFKPEGFGEVVDSQLHIFADASESAYAAVAYVRLVDVHGRVHCSFVMGKVRLCPLKVQTIPRLELMAAVLAVKLSQVAQAELRMPIAKPVFWTDSTSVLQYIRNESKRFHTFVANRIAKIQSSTEVSQWRHVDTASNPADDGSRGMRAVEMTESHRWLIGPGFLWKGDDCWPAIPVSLSGDPQDLCEVSKADPELRKQGQVLFVERKSVIDDLMCRYSSWNRLKRVVARILRLKKCLLARVRADDREAGGQGRALSLEELQAAEMAIIRYVQHQSFAPAFEALEAQKQEDIPCQRRKSEVPSTLRKLNPMIQDGILRVGGRIRNAPLEYDVIHPVILPSDHHVTALLIVHHHLLVGHSGVGMTWSSLRDKFWVVRGGATVRRVIGKCFRCKRRNAGRGQQFMGELPAVRVIPERPPFTFVGVDYFGPLYVKQGRSSVKRYGCVFTCLVVRAVHIEVAHSLDTDSFVNALRRFISRRGKPEKILSDNGTNFVGGERELRESLAEINQDRVCRVLHEKGIDWEFNPPTASHFGGAWERMIRSIRKILKGLLGEQVVTDEVLLTLMAEVEAILNARPLTRLSLDPKDKEPLTPNHLLLMQGVPAMPPGVFDKKDCYGRRRWRQTQYLADQFWKRWLREYLPLLQTRQKWSQPQRNFKVDDLVLLVDDTLPRGQWSMGLVTAVYPDQDGNVRQVEVKVGNRFLRRPIVKLCLLEMGDEK